jgi:hypothetical protein
LAAGGHGCASRMSSTWASIRMRRRQVPFFLMGFEGCM